LAGTEAQKAAKRFKRLPELTNLPIEEILPQNIKRKHALSVIACVCVITDFVNE
jgi:hypothetical protein